MKQGLRLNHVDGLLRWATDFGSRSSFLDRQSEDVCSIVFAPVRATLRFACVLDEVTYEN